MHSHVRVKDQLQEYTSNESLTREVVSVSRVAQIFKSELFMAHIQTILKDILY